MKCKSMCNQGEPEFWCKCGREAGHEGDHFCGICGETWE